MTVTDEDLRRIAEGRENHNDTGPGPGSAPAEALAAARVDLVELIRNGIPERDLVPGCKPWLLRGKRYLVPDAAGEGKSLGFTVVGVEVVKNGGTVGILDVENGAEEYARRLEDILGGQDELTDGRSERLRYYAWPALRPDWNGAESAAAVAGADLVIFDSSRLILTGMGLAEDSNDDYSTFVNTMLVPLTRADIATVTLDNEGHEGGRARGASDKGDLNEVVYIANRGKPFDLDETGELHLYRKRTRFPELPKQLTIELGGGVYKAPVVAEAGDETKRYTGYMERISRVVEEVPGLPREEVLNTVGGTRNYASKAFATLVAEGFISGGEDRKKAFRSVRPYREADDDQSQD